VPNLVKKYNYLIILASLTVSLLLDYLIEGANYHIYLLPTIAAATTLPLLPSLLITGLTGLLSIFTASLTNAVEFIDLTNCVIYALTALVINLFVKQLTSNKDTLIQELSTNLDLNKTLHTIILNDSKTAVEVVNANGKIVNWNDKARQLTGFAEAIGKYHSELFSPVDTGQNKILDTLHSGKEYLDQEITLLIPDRKPVTALVNTYVLRNDFGKIIGALAIYRDITEKKFLERQVQQAEKFAALGQMAAGLAHEIRNPLTTVKGFLQLISPDYLGPKYSEYRDLMLDEVNRTNRLVSNFILLANPPAPVYKKVQFNHLVETVIDLLKDKASAHDITLENKVRPLPPVYLDEEQFKHLLLLLADNAIDAMPEGGTFGVKAEIIEEFIQIQVWDTGSGIPLDIVDKIFDPFFTTKDSGSGLGLSIIYNIIKSHQGSISVSSHPDSGTKFKIVLPVEHPVTYLSKQTACSRPDFYSREMVDSTIPQNTFPVA